MARLDGVAGDIRKHLPRLHCPLELAGGKSFPLGEGRSAKSMYHPAKIWSTRAFGKGGRPCPRKTCCAAGFSGI